MNYAKFQKIACKQIKKYGQLVTFRFPAGNSDYDPVSGQITMECIEADTYAVLLRPKEKDIASGTVQVGDAMLLVGGDTLPHIPDETATVIIQGVEWHIVQVDQVAPSGLAIIYKVFIRKA